jgi:hypothetical protein
VSTKDFLRLGVPLEHATQLVTDVVTKFIHGAWREGGDTNSIS